MMSRKTNTVDCSLLDIHKYSKQAFHMLYQELNDKFDEEHGEFKAITSFIAKIVKEDQDVYEIIKSMDTVDGIKAQNSKTSNEKRVETWLKKAYYEHLYRSYAISRNYLLSFMLQIINPESEEGKRQLRYSSTRYFELYNDKFKKRLKRCRTNERIQELQAKYPKLNVTDAFAFGLIIEKFQTSNEDIEWFEDIIKILLKTKSTKAEYLILR